MKYDTAIQRWGIREEDDYDRDREERILYGPRRVGNEDDMPRAEPIG